MQNYPKEVKGLREDTLSGQSIATKNMVKTEKLDPELSEIGWRRLNLTWRNGYSHNRYIRGLDLIIHKYPSGFRPSHLIPIPLFDIEANLHNKHLGIFSVVKAEELGVLDSEKYVSRTAKATDTQAINTRLFMTLLD